MKSIILTSSISDNFFSSSTSIYCGNCFCWSIAALKGTGTEDLTVVNYTLSNEVLINPFQVNFYLMEWWLINPSKDLTFLLFLLSPLIPIALKNVITYWICNFCWLQAIQGTMSPFLFPLYWASTMVWSEVFCKYITAQVIETLEC